MMMMIYFTSVSSMYRHETPGYPWTTDFVRGMEIIIRQKNRKGEKIERKGKQTDKIHTSNDKHPQEPGSTEMISWLTVMTDQQTRKSQGRGG